LQIDVSSDHSESVVQNRKSIHFESFAADSAGKPLVPRAIGLTEFHLVLLYSDRVVAVCILNEQPVYETTFREVSLIFTVSKLPVNVGEPFFQNVSENQRNFRSIGIRSFLSLKW